jgi:threonine dehydratase
MDNISIQNLIDAHEILTDEILHIPLEYSHRLSKQYNCNVWLKREDKQVVRSFKIRGACYNIINNLKDIINNNKIIVCASAGNHAQGVVYICHKYNIKCIIFVPDCTPMQKIKKIKYHGGEYCEIIVNGNTFDECLKESLEYSAKNNGFFVHPYDDINTIIGQSTLTVDICTEIDPDYLILPIGGGGLIAGACLTKKLYKKNFTIIGAEPESCASMKYALIEKKPVIINTSDLFVDGATVKKVGDITFDICNNNICSDNIYKIPIGKICEDIVDFHQYDGIIAEPAGALSVSTLAFMKKEDIINKNIVCVISGGNNDILRYQEIMNRSLMYKKLVHYYIIKFTQKPGELRTYINNILEKNMDIIRFEYLKKTNKEYGNVLIGIQIEYPDDIQELKKRMDENNITYIELNENDQLFNFIV